MTIKHLELAKKNGVTVHALPYAGVWVADIANDKNELIRFTRLSDLIKYLDDNGIKINN